MICIGGYGRSGSSFLVQILTHLGFKTGWDKATVDRTLDHPSRAGLERVEASSKNSNIEVFKRPGFFNQCKLNKEEYGDIEFFIIPIRGIDNAVKSSLLCNKLGSGGRGGTHNKTAEENRIEKLFHFGKDVDTCVLYDIPFTFLKYPKYINDIEYFYDCLLPILKKRGITFEQVKDTITSLRREPRIC